MDSFRGILARRPEGDGVPLSKYKVHSTSIFVLNNVCKPARPSTWGFKSIQREGGGGGEGAGTETETHRQTDTQRQRERDRGVRGGGGWGVGRKTDRQRDRHTDAGKIRHR